MLEKLQAKTSFISARWWVKFLITELAQTKNVKCNNKLRAQRLLSYALFDLFLEDFVQGAL